MIGPNIFLATTNNFCKMKVFKQYQKMSKEKEIFAHLKEMYDVGT